MQQYPDIKIINGGNANYSISTGKQLTATAHRVANGIASCSWSVPRTATGTLRGTISLTVQGTTVVRAFAVKVSSS